MYLRDIVINPKTNCILMGRVGWSDQIIVNTTIEELSKNENYNDKCPQSLIIPSKMTEYEIEFLNTFSTN